MTYAPGRPHFSGPPDLLTRAQLRGYLQLTERELTKRLRLGQIAGPLWGCDAALYDALWDKQAVDRAIDKASATPSVVDAAGTELDLAFGPSARARKTAKHRSTR